MDFGGPHKRGRPEAGFIGNGGVKKSRPESDSFLTGVGSKLKPCTKFFSTSGCSFGEGCHFLHYVPGGYKAVAQMVNQGSAPLPPSSRSSAIPSSFPDGSSTGKNKMCNKYNSPEGCKFGDKCRFAHGEWELAQPSIIPSYDVPLAMGPPPMAGRIEPPSSGFGATPNFGTSATAKISIEAFLAGTVIGKSGSNSKQICRLTGVKLAIRDHESDPNLKNIELKGNFDQIKQASSMVGDVIANVKASSGPPAKHTPGGFGTANSYKTKLCENFAKGSCTFGDKCHFAHGDDQLRKTAV